MSRIRSQLDRFAAQRNAQGAQPAIASAVEAAQRHVDGSLGPKPRAAGPEQAHSGAAQGAWRTPAGPQANQRDPAWRETGRPGSPNPAEFARLQSALQQVRQQLTDVTGRLASPRGGDNSEARTIAGLGGEIAKMREQGSAAATVLQQIASELIALRRDHASIAQAAANPPHAEELLRSIRDGYADVANRLEGAIGKLQSSAVEDRQTDERIAILSEHVTAIRDSIESLPVRFPIAAVHDQLEGLAGALDQLVGSNEQKFAAHFNELSERLDEVTRALVTLSVAPGGTDSLDRIEARIASLTKSVEYLATQTPSGGDRGFANAFADEVRDALSAMNTQLGELGRFDGAQFVHALEGRLAGISEKLEYLPTGQGEGGEADTDTIARLDAISRQIAAIQPAAAEPAWLARSEVLEQRFSELAERLDQSLSAQQAAPGQDGIEASASLRTLTDAIDRLQNQQRGDSEAELLDRIHDQISAINERIASFGQGIGDFGPLGERLDALEHQIALSRDIAIDVAGQAAERAVSLFSGKEAGGDAGLDNGETLEVLRGMLGDMSARLGEIEQNLDDRANYGHTAEEPVHLAPQSEYPAQQFRPGESYDETADTAAYRDEEPHPAAPAPHQDTFEYSQQPQEEGGLPEIQDAPQLDDAGEAPYQPQETAPSDFAEEQLAVDDLPLEPGSGAPDLAALVKRASENRQKGIAGSPVPASEVIAAARRAARIASQESAAFQESLPSEPEKTPAKGSRRSLSAIAGLLAGKRKLILTTALVAAVIAVGGPMAMKFVSGGDQPQQAEIAGQVDAGEKAEISEQAQDEDASAQAAGVAEDNQSTDAAGVEEEPLAAESQSSSDEASRSIAGSAGDQQQAAQSGELEAEQAAVNGAQDRQIGDAVPRIAPEPGKSITNAPMPPQEVGNIALREAAAAGDGAALFEVARRYTDGDQVERDLAKAAEWYEHAAKAGFAPAQYRLGNFHEKGVGVAIDIVKAAQWYDKAARNGNALAMHNLAVLQTSGLLAGGPDLRSAGEWFSKAADVGVKDSQVNLGILYSRGMGVPENLVEAYKWFAVAAKAGDADAATKRDTLAKAMRPEQLQEARGKAELWKPGPIDLDANQPPTRPEWGAGSGASAKLSDNELTARIQKLLAEQGFDPGPSDGLMGAKTRDAIKAFQKKHGLNIDGAATPQLLEELKKAAA